MCVCLCVPPGFCSIWTNSQEMQARFSTKSTRLCWARSLLLQDTEQERAQSHTVKADEIMLDSKACWLCLCLTQDALLSSKGLCSTVQHKVDKAVLDKEPAAGTQIERGSQHKQREGAV